MMDPILILGTYSGELLGYHVTWNPNDAVSLKLIFAFSAHAGCVKCLGANEALLLSGSSDETIRIYDLKKRQEIGLLEDHGASISALEILCLGSHIYAFSAAYDGSLSLWNTSDWSNLIQLKGHTGKIVSLAVHPTGRTCLSVSGSPEKALRLWNLARGTCAMTQIFHEEPVLIKWAPCGLLYGCLFPKKLLIRHCLHENIFWEISPPLNVAVSLTSFCYLSDHDLVVGDTSSNIRGIRLTGSIDTFSTKNADCCFSYTFMLRIEATAMLEGNKKNNGRIKSLCSLTQAYQHSYHDTTSNLYWFASVTSIGILSIWSLKISELHTKSNTLPHLSYQTVVEARITAMVCNLEYGRPCSEKIKSLLQDIKYSTSQHSKLSHKTLKTSSKNKIHFSNTCRKLSHKTEPKKLKRYNFNSTRWRITRCYQRKLDRYRLLKWLYLRR